MKPPDSNCLEIPRIRDHIGSCGHCWKPEMRELQLREAKATLSAVIDAAEHGEPTTITKHGRRAAVVISHDEWTRLKSKVPSFADLLLAVPALDPDDLPKRRPARIVGEGAPD